MSFRFNPTGARKFGDYTAENIGSPFAIALDGEVISAPVIRSPYSRGDHHRALFSRESDWRSAACRPCPPLSLEERTIGPELGADGVAAGKTSITVAFAAVLLFMVLSYGLFGLFCKCGVDFEYRAHIRPFKRYWRYSDAPGIAGIVLTIGMAVDANVLIFERIREELKTAKGPARAIELGYERALSAIMDANITTFITAVILFAMGSGPVRGFSVTLGIGILTSVFTAIFVTRLLVVMWFERARPKALEL